MTGPTSHYKYAPSSSNRWIACPYSAQDDLPKFENAAALEGTAAHEWAANVLQKDVAMSDVPLKFTDGVSMYVDHINARGMTPIVERKWASFEVQEHGGTIDCLLYETGNAVLYDFKYGKWPVPAKGNSQLLCYAGILCEHFDVQSMEVCIVQPNAFKGPKIKTADITLGEVAEHREKVVHAVNSNEKNTGDHCRFCPLRLTDQCREGVVYGIAKGW